MFSPFKICLSNWPVIPFHYGQLKPVENLDDAVWILNRRNPNSIWAVARNIHWSIFFLANPEPFRVFFCVEIHPFNGWVALEAVGFFVKIRVNFLARVVAYFVLESLTLLKRLCPATTQSSWAVILIITGSGILSLSCCLVQHHQHRHRQVN